MRKRLKQGLVQVYFGRGKGKTTAALGQGFRATGHGFKVYMIQFMKGNTR
jgi:cob(I)alamin adenosyltransferase